MTRAVGDYLACSQGRKWKSGASLDVRWSLDPLDGVTFALLLRFRELVWIELGLLCLALVGWRTAAIQEGHTLDSESSS